MFITPSRYAIGLSSALSSFLLAASALAAPIAAPAVPSAPASAATQPPVITGAPMQLHAGYPTTREKWRYCPRDGSHQCVELDIPGVTVPEQPTDRPRTGQ